MSLRSTLQSITNALYPPSTATDPYPEYTDDYSIPSIPFQEEGFIASRVISNRMQTEPFLKDTQRFREVLWRLGELGDATKSDDIRRDQFKELLGELVGCVDDEDERRELIGTLVKQFGLIDGLSESDSESLESSNYEDSMDYIDESQNDSCKDTSIVEMLKIAIIPSSILPISLPSIPVNQVNYASSTRENSGRQDNTVDEEGIQLIVKVISFINRKITFNKRFFTNFLNFLVFLTSLFLNLLRFCLTYIGGANDNRYAMKNNSFRSGVQTRNRQNVRMKYNKSKTRLE